MMYAVIARGRSSVSRRVRMILLCLGVALVAAQGVAHAAPPGDGWRRVFHDEFNGNKLDKRKWATGYPFGQMDGHQAFMAPENVRVRDGQLVLTGTRGRHRNAPRTFTADGQTYSLDYTSGAIHNRGNFTLSYGYVESRMKLPATIGSWPAFWMLRRDGDWPPEIDVMEMAVSREFDLRKYHYNYHHGPSPEERVEEGDWYLRGPNFAESFHTFGMGWGTDYIEWYLDDQLVDRVEGDFFDRATDMILILNLGLGGWPGPPPPDAVFDAKMRVDWVRAYRRESVGAGARAVPESGMWLIALAPVGWIITSRRGARPSRTQQA